MPEDNKDKQGLSRGEVCVRASISMGPMNSGVKKPSTPKPVMTSLPPNSSGQSNDKSCGTRIVKRNPNDTKNGKK